MGLIPKIPFPATFPYLPLNGLAWLDFDPKVDSNTGGGGEGGGGEWGAGGAENFGFCGRIRALQTPGNSDTEGELGKVIRLRERSK